MSKPDLTNNLSWLFLQASFRSKQTLMRLAEEYDLSLPQLYTLVFMEPENPLQMNEIAAILHCDPSNVTGIIDRMFAGKYIERQEKPNDRRARLVALTPEGIKLRDVITSRIAENQPKIFDNLNDEQKLELTDLLKKLLAQSPSLLQ
jgi:DNA-binding MarR family transcriptional regulator